ncbi:putative glutamine ABC transporter permease protein GlnP [bacterium HR12]|nr:putative glutamine ABC transporter permease protein GlnP [bacterium HR12]
MPRDPAFWGVVALVLSYSAYVAEVYRAGIESVHPSQVAAARSLGLGRWPTLRYVVIPQAVRRVIPPLLNDFVALQKDTALIAFVVAAPEAFKMAQIQQAARFNFTPLLAAALMFLVITVPLTRIVDWLVARERRRREAGGGL